MTEDTNINKLFKDVFENLEVAPPVSVKMEIDKQLGPKRKFRFIFWWLPVLLLLLGGVAFAVVRYGSNESETQKAQVAVRQNSTTVEKGSSSSNDNLSEVSSSSTTSDPDQRKEKQSADQREQRQAADKSDAESKDEKFTSGEAKQQRFTLKKGSKTQYNEKESIAKKQAGSSKSVKRKTAAKPNKSKKSSQKVSGNSLQAGVGSKRIKGTTGNPKQKPDPGQANLPGSHGETDPADAKPKEGDSELSKTSSGKDEKQKDGAAKKEPADSVQKADSSAVAAKTDSLVKPGEDPAKVKPSKNDSKAKKWMVELYGGPRFGVKTSKTEFVLKEAASYQIGLGFSRNLELGPLKYVTLDGEYGSGKESYKQNITTSSIYFVGIDSIPYFDTIGDTIPAGYTYFNDYDTTTSTIESTRNSTITRFAFGLKAQFNFTLGSGFGLAVVPGYYYSMSKFKFSDSGTVSTSSSQILLGLGVYYDWNRFRFRVGLDTRYELMRKNNDLFVDRRKSLLFLPQIGVAFKF